MDFAFTAEQLAVRDMARELFAKHYGPARLRELYDGAERTGDAWSAMAEAGLTGLGVGEEHGGSGGDAIDLMLVLEEVGRACVPDPLLDTVAVGVAVLSTTENERLAQRWLPAIAAGDATIAVQLEDQPYAVDADIADLLLLEVDGGVHALEAGQFEAHHVPSEDRTRRLFHVEVEVGERIADIATARRIGTLGSAAMLNGVAGALLDMTLAYVKVRHQFGVPVGSFQAVKHKLATLFSDLESSRAATRYAAYAVARRLDDRNVAVSVAKVHAVAAASLANTEALQCHAGIGFTWEHDLHFWLNRGRALEHDYGSAREHRALLAAALLDL